MIQVEFREEGRYISILENILEVKISQKKEADLLSGDWKFEKYTNIDEREDDERLKVENICEYFEILQLYDKWEALEANFYCISSKCGLIIYRKFKNIGAPT